MKHRVVSIPLAIHEPDPPTRRRYRCIHCDRVYFSPPQNDDCQERTA